MPSPIGSSVSVSTAPVLNPISLKYGEIPFCAVIPSSSSSARTCSGVMSSTKSTSPLMRAWTLGSLARIDPELDLVDVRPVAPVVVVGHEAELGAAGGPFDRDERAGADSGLSGVGSGWKVLTSSLLTSFQMCSGTIGIGSRGKLAFGFDRVSTTVVSSGAVTDSTLLR